MKMHCKNCGIKFYPSENNYVGYPYGGWRNKGQAHTRVFHSRGCWENWHKDHRDDIERVIRTRGEWKS